MDELVSSTQLCERCGNFARHCCCSPTLGGSDDPRTAWRSPNSFSEEEPEEASPTATRRVTTAGKQPRGHVSFVDDEAEEAPEEPDLADYFGQFQMTRKEVIEFCRAHASALAKQEAYSRKISKKIKIDPKH